MDPKVFGDSPAGRLIRAPTGYWAFVPPPLPPMLTWTPTVVAALSQADRALGELAGLGRSLLKPHLLIAPFVRREAVLSSRIEGTQASLSDLYAYEVVQKTAVPSTIFEPPADVHEVYNYVQALEYGLNRLQSLPLSLRLIREIHARLMEGVRGEHGTPGEFRRSQNWIGPPGCRLEDAAILRNHWPGAEPGLPGRRDVGRHRRAAGAGGRTVTGGGPIIVAERNGNGFKDADIGPTMLHQLLTGQLREGALSERVNS